MRASVRSRLRWRMISWPAAKQIRWVNPSMATVSPSRTSSATASFIVATLLTGHPPGSRPAIGRPPVLRASEDAELVPLGVEHDRPEAPVLLDEPLVRGARLPQPLHLGGHRSWGTEVEVDPVLHDFRLRNSLEVEPVRGAAGADERLVVLDVDGLVAEGDAPELGEASWVGAIEAHRVDGGRHGTSPFRYEPPASATASSKTSSAVSAWSRRNTSGGHIRITSSPATSTSNPRRNAACSTAITVSWSSNSIPIIMPRPR